MKKIDKSAQARNVATKLKLSRETLRWLDAAQLQDVIGGTFVTCVGEDCKASETDCGTKNIGG